MMPGFKPINTFPVIFLDVVVVVVSWVSTSGNKFAFVCLPIAFKLFLCFLRIQIIPLA